MESPSLRNRTFFIHSQISGDPIRIAGDLPESGLTRPSLSDDCGNSPGLYSKITSGPEGKRVGSTRHPHTSMTSISFNRSSEMDAGMLYYTVTVWTSPIPCAAGIPIRPTWGPRQGASRMRRSHSMHPSGGTVDQPVSYHAADPNLCILVTRRETTGAANRRARAR